MKHRDDLTRGLPLPSTWVNAIMEFVGTLDANWRLERPTATTVRVPAGAGNDQVALGMAGKWRLIAANATATHPGGAAGVYDLYATANANDLTAVDPLDNTNYTFALTIRARVGGNPDPPPASGATALSRRVAEVHWDGAAITRVVNLVNRGRGGDPVVAGTTNAAEVPLVGVGAAGQTANLLQLEDSAGASKLSVSPAGVVNLAAGGEYRINGASIFASPALTGTPTAPTAAAATSTTQIATTAFVQAAAALGYQPLDSDLTALAALAAGGLVARTGAGTAAARSIVGTANRVTVTNGDGVAGNPTLTGPQDIHTGATPTFSSLILGSATGSIDIGGTADAVVKRVGAGILTLESAAMVATGIQPAAGAGAGATGGSMALAAAKGGNTTGTTGQQGGVGGSVQVVGGAGGNAPGGSTNGTGGNLVLYAGSPGAGAGAAGQSGTIFLGQAGDKLGFLGAGGVTRRTGWGAVLASNFTGAVSRKSLTAAYTMNELRDVVATIVDELRTYGLLVA
jgi:hypothetical protein